MIIGKKVIDIRPMTKAEIKNVGWEYCHTVPMVMVFEDDTKIFASQDEEGNGAGALFGVDKEGEFLLMPA